MTLKTIPKRRRWLIISVIFLAFLFNYFDKQIVSILKPVLKSHFGFNNSGYAVIVNILTIFYALMYSLSGWIVDKFEAGKAMFTRIIDWSLACLGDSLSRTLGQFTFSRAMLVLGSIFFVSFANAQSANKTNIVFIFADDLGYMDTGYNGSDYYETPNIDMFAKENLVFPNAYSSAANCAPSRGALISGQYSPRTGIYAVNSTNRGPVSEMRLMPVPNTNYISPKNYTVAMALKNAGYNTGIFGKWHIGNTSGANDPGSMGFDVVMDNDGKKKQSVVKDPKAMFEIADSAINFIKASKNKPFFAYISHHAVHSNHQAREETLKKFKAKAKGKYHKKALFAACIYDFDATVGKVLAYLKETGLDKNTLVVFSSDNGGGNASIQEPLRGNKGSYYEGGVRVPFIVRWPGKTRAGVNNTPIINLDLYPTFATLAGAKIPSNKVLDGENLLPVFSGQNTTTVRDKIFWHFPGYLNNPVTRGRDTIFRTRPVTTMRKGDFKILLYHEEWVLDGGFSKRATNNSIELYNLKTDLGEHNNIVASNPQKRDELLKDLLEWMDTTHAKMATVRTPKQEAMKNLPQKKKKKNEDDD